MYCKNCGTEIPNDSNYCFSCGVRFDLSLDDKSTVRDNPEVKFEEELYHLRVLITSRDQKEILKLLEQIIDSKENGEIVLKNYGQLFSGDLIEELKSLSNSYEKIKTYVQKFIDFGIILDKYPHTRKDESKNIWKAQLESTSNQKKGFFTWKVILLIAVILFVFNIWLNSFRDNSPTEPITNQSSIKYAKIGESIEVEHFIYRVNSIQYEKSLGNEFMTQKADGIYLIIDLSLKNQDNEEHTLDGSLFQLTDTRGTEYESSTDATTALMMSGNETLFLKECNPNIQKQGYLAFEVPGKGEYYLRLSGGFWTGETATVKLTNN